MKTNQLEPSPAASCSPSLEALKGLKGVEYSKAWNKLHRDKCRAAARAWRKRNPEKVKARLRAFVNAPDMIEHRKKRVRERRRLEYRGSGKGKKRYYSGWEAAAERHERWCDVDDCLVMAREMTDRELSLQIGRSVNAIQIRRRKLTKENLEENAVAEGREPPANFNTTDAP